MKNRTNLIRWLPFCAVAFSFLLGVEPVGADMLDVGSQSFSGISNGTTNFSFATFNQSLGTLTSVTIELNGVTLFAEESVYNISGSVYPGYGQAEDISVQMHGNLNISAPASTGIGLTATTPNYTFYNVADGSSAGPVPVTQSPTPNNSNGTTTALTSYESGTSATVTVGVAASGFYLSSTVVQSSGTDAAHLAAGYAGSASASGMVDVIYTYTPVPEPKQMAAWMLGFALCVLAGRRYLQRDSAVRPLS